MKTIEQIRTEMDDILQEIRIDRELLDKALNGRCSGGGEEKRLQISIAKLKKMHEFLAQCKVYLQLSSEEHIRESYSRVDDIVKNIEHSSADLQKELKKVYRSNAGYEKYKKQRDNLAYLLGD